MNYALDYFNIALPGGLVATIGFIGLLLLVGGIRSLIRKRTSMQHTNAPGGIVNHASNQGSQTVNNFGPPPPSIRVVEERPSTPNQDGTFTQVTVIEIVAASPPNSLRVAVDRSEVAPVHRSFGIHLSPVGGGVYASDSGATADAAWARIISPVGQYVIAIRAKSERSPVSIRYELK